MIISKFKRRIIMAKENVKAFFEALTKEGSIQKALKEKELVYTGAKDDRNAIVKEVLIPVAEAAGYTFTVDELKEFEQDMQAKGELSEDELEAVAGGVEDWGICTGLGLAYGESCFILGLAGCLIVGGGV
jgi:predicted ribosomally synthesized peptide with nif11-like leader